MFIKVMKKNYPFLFMLLNKLSQNIFGLSVLEITPDAIIKSNFPNFCLIKISFFIIFTRT